MRVLACEHMDIHFCMFMRTSIHLALLAIGHSSVHSAEALLVHLEHACLMHYFITVIYNPIYIQWHVTL